MDCTSSGSAPIASLAVWASLMAAVPFAMAHPAPPPSPESQAAPSSAPEPPQATEPADALPEYGGDLNAREFLSGDWGGHRTALAAKGLTFDLGWTQVVQGVVSGGRRQDWDYGGNIDLALNADFERIGLGSIGSLVIRAESRYGETVNDDTGAFTPVNTRGYFPLAGEINEGIPLTVTELTYTLPMGETLELGVGKMLTAEGDPTEFAGGAGRSQFLNSNFIYNATTSQTAPYSTLGASVDWTPADWLTLSTSAFATTDSSTTTGFESLDDGWTWWTQVETRYRLGTLPGGFNAGFQYALDNEFARIGGQLSLISGGNGIETVSDSWAVFMGAWQYIYAPDGSDAEIDAWDRRADLKGLGLFTRLGFADPDANPVNWSASVGLGGRGGIAARDDDTFGVGYYYTDIENSKAFSMLGLASSTQGLEMYYNIAITPAAGLTLDIQCVEEGFETRDAATVVGMRLDLEF